MKPQKQGAALLVDFLLFIFTAGLFQLVQSINHDPRPKL